MSSDSVPPASPLPCPAEKAKLDFITGQTARIAAQEQEISALWKEVKTLQSDKLSAVKEMNDAVRETKELGQKYSQLRLEAWLDLAKVAIVVVAVALVLVAKFDRLPDVLKALPRAEAPSDRAGKPTAVSPGATQTSSQTPAK